MLVLYLYAYCFHWSILLGKNCHVRQKLPYPIRSEELSFTNTLFFNNSATNGGALRISLATLICDVCNFTANACAASGSAVSLEEGGFHALSSLFTNNNAQLYGTVASVSSALVITNVTMTSNRVGAGGGAFFISSGTTAVIVDSVLSDNTAEEGGAIYIEYTSTANVQNTLIEDNTATENAGSIYCRLLRSSGNKWSFFGFVNPKPMALD